MRNRLDEGIFFFNEGRYFDAHETWEEMWREQNGDLRLFLQGLVQAAVALHHLSARNLVGARAQLRKSIEKLDQFAPDEAGIDVAKLRQQLRQVLERVDVATPSTVRIIRLRTKPVVVES
jgi:predicted metal-dependent hydrolase